ncbi:hypothetical protein WR25_08083 [Diploscapter pachys]|uniref:Uncharacterized protein n=1 Tax=Diploscapter pachys TaxID=2018661 RepID=A0A2A2L1R0_9BILA|nr:hypothetical protein WR25_08083 [Diploscapter pachys]
MNFRHSYCIMRNESALASASAAPTSAFASRESATATIVSRRRVAVPRPRIRNVVEIAARGIAIVPSANAPNKPLKPLTLPQ